MNKVWAKFRWLCLIAIATTFLAFAVVAQVRKPAASFRTITVITEPNAAIWIDGVKYGATDESGKLTIKTIAPGRRVMRVRADGFAEVSKLLPAAHKGETSIPLAKTTDEAELTFQEAERLTSSDRAKAADAYRKAIRLKPKYVNAHIGLARVLSESGDPEAAQKAIREFRKVSPANAEASVIEGRIYKDLDDEKKAIASFKRAIAEGKGFQPEAYTGLGLLFKEKAEGLGGAAELGQESAAFAEAAKNLSVAVKQLAGAPDAIVVYQLLGLVYERQKKFKEAIAIYEEFLRVFPDVSEAAAVESFIVQIKKQMAEQE